MTCSPTTAAWAARMERDRPGFFTRLVKQQAPKYLWIGCSDSRVPANQIIGLVPGELFVHRNVANVVVHSDLNCLSVIQFAVDVLKVKHIIVVGHYGCGGVRAALEGARIGLADNWMRHIQDVRDRHRVLLDESLPETLRADALCELNVMEQVRQRLRQHRRCATPGRAARRWRMHGWVYGVHNGLLQDLRMTVASPEAIERGSTALALARAGASRDTAADGDVASSDDRCSRSASTDRRAYDIAQGDARRLQPPLPAVPRGQPRAPSSASRRPTGTASSARSASASSSTTCASTRRWSGCRSEFDAGDLPMESGSRSSCTTSAC